MVVLAQTPLSHFWPFQLLAHTPTDVFHSDMDWAKYDEIERAPTAGFRGRSRDVRSLVSAGFLSVATVLPTAFGAGARGLYPSNLPTAHLGHRRLLFFSLSEFRIRLYKYRIANGYEATAEQQLLRAFDSQRCATKSAEV